LVASILSMVGILIAMFILNPWLALATLLVVPIMLWFTDFVAKDLYKINISLTSKIW